MLLRVRLERRPLAPPIASGEIVRQLRQQLVPDEPISVTVEKAGYTTTEQVLNLSEGQKREVTLVLKKAPDDKSPGEQADEK